MSSIFKEDTLEVFKKIRQIFLKVIVGIVIGEIILLAILIIAQNMNEVIGRMMGTLFIIVIWLAIIMSCFRCIEKKQSVAQVLAVICLITSVFWFIFQLLEMWGVIAMFEGTGTSLWDVDIRLTPIARIITLVSNVMIDALFGAWISSIEENGGPIKPLKITALSSLAFMFVVSTIQTLGTDTLGGTVAALYGLAFFSLIITWCMASTISRRNNKEAINAVAKNGAVNIQDNEEIQKQIREMVEKEVQERMKEEKKED